MKQLVFIFFLFTCSSQLFCQQDSTADYYFDAKYKHGMKYTFKTSAGTVFKGFVINETYDFVSVENRDVHETYELRKSEIISARIYTDRQSYEDLNFGENYHAHHYMMAQSALPFEEGKATTTSHLLLLDNIDYGLSENWALSANTFAFFYPISVGIKCSFEVSEKNYVGGDLFGIGVNYSGTGQSVFGYGFMGKYTKGDSNENFTAFGGVIGLNTDVLFNTSAAFVNTSFFGAAYCRRLSQRVALNAEGWFLPGAEVGLLGAAVKLVGNDITSWTFGCYTLLTERNNSLQLSLKTLPIPYFGVSRNF